MPATMGGAAAPKPSDRQAAASAVGCDGARSGAAAERTAGRDRARLPRNPRRARRRLGLRIAAGADRPDGDRGAFHDQAQLPRAPTTTWFRRGSFARRRSPVGRGEPFPLAITFDDDLRSHVELALPILPVAGAPATFFLTGASLQGPASFWWERLDRALRLQRRLPSCSGRRIPASALATVAALPASEREELSAALLGLLGGEDEPQRAPHRARRRTRRGRLRDRLPHP